MREHGVLQWQNVRARILKKREKARTVTYVDRQEHGHKCDLIRRTILQKKIKQIM